MSLSKVEQETVILFNEAEPTATINTCNKAMQNRLDGFCSKSNDIYREESQEPFKRYVCPKSWVKVRMPRQLSKEQREKLASRARANFQKTEYDQLIEQIERGDGIPNIGDNADVLL